MIFKIKNGRNPQKRLMEVSADFNVRKQYDNRTNPQNSWSAGGDPLENPSGKEHAERDFAPYMDIMPIVSSQRK